MDNRTLKDNFIRYFTIVPAITEELINVAKVIRHKVYCEELGWEATKANNLDHISLCIFYFGQGRQPITIKPFMKCQIGNYVHVPNLLD